MSEFKIRPLNTKTRNPIVWLQCRWAVFCVDFEVWAYGLWRRFGIRMGWTTKTVEERRAEVLSYDFSELDKRRDTDDK